MNLRKFRQLSSSQQLIYDHKHQSLIGILTNALLHWEKGAVISWVGLMIIVFNNCPNVRGEK
jgi:hypothetical protein